MTIDLGFSGQESDVNRACSAFGLDTVNYRAFPNNGPVLTPEPEPIPPTSKPESAPAPSPAEVALQQQIQQPSLSASDSAPPLPPPSPGAPMPAAHQWTQGAAAAAFPAGPIAGTGNFPRPVMPPASVPPSDQNQNPAGTAGAGFALLRQALPSAYAGPASPMQAFALARAPLQPLPPSSGIRSAEARPVQPRPVANPESFGIAFGTAFNAAFGNGGTGTPGPNPPPGFQPAQN